MLFAFMQMKIIWNLACKYINNAWRNEATTRKLKVFVRIKRVKRTKTKDNMFRLRLLLYHLLTPWKNCRENERRKEKEKLLGTCIGRKGKEETENIRLSKS